MRILAIAALLLSALPAYALEIQKVSENIYAIVGPLDQRSADNLANNATFGVVVTDEGVVLIDTGGSWLGAKALHAAVREITDQPVKFVINSGGQDHRWIGNDYWQQQGAVVIAAKAAVADQKDRGSVQMSGLSFLIGDKLEGLARRHTQQVFSEMKWE